MYAHPSLYSRRSSATGLGSVTRIYKNAAGDTIGIDEILVEFFAVQKVNQSTTLHDNEFVHFVKIDKIKRTVMFPSVAASRVVASMKVIVEGGKSYTVSVDAGDYLTVTWTLPSSTGTTVTAGLDLPDVAKIGDTI